MQALCHSVTLCIDPSRIAYLRFILEGYDGMAYMTTLDAKRGHVVLRFVPSFARELFELLADVAHKIRTINT